MRGLYLALAMLMFAVLYVQAAGVQPGQSTRAGPSIEAAVIVPVFQALETQEENSIVYGEPMLTLRAQPNSGDVRSGGGNAADMVSLAVTCKQRFRPLGDDSAVLKTDESNDNRAWYRLAISARLSYNMRV